MSTGMKQKVSIARAIVHDPPVLIFDEATSGLDVLVARACLKTVAELRDRASAYFSTHIMREAEKLCDRWQSCTAAILAEGTLAELRDRMKNTIWKSCFFGLIVEHEANRTERGAMRADTCPAPRSRLSDSPHPLLASSSVHWPNVKLICLREFRDQLRDR